MSVDHPSVWTEPPTSRSGDRLGADASCDVCIVGAGIAGLTTAYRLTRKGKSVLVLEAKDEFAAAETGHTTAHLSSVIDDRFSRLKSIRGADNAKLAYQAHATAIDTIEGIARDEGIDCDFAREDGYLFPAGRNAPETMNDEDKAVKELGIPYERVNLAPVPALSGPCLRFPQQAQFHPLKYLAGVAKAVIARGGRIVTGARVEKVEDGDPCRVTIRGGRTVTAKAVVLATNTPINNGVALNTKIAAYQTYAVAIEVPAGTVPRALYWDTEDPYHYVRLFAAKEPAGGPNLLIVGGEDHKTGQAKDQEERWARLEAWTRERFLETKAVRYRWSGEVFETLDGLALIGPGLGGEKNVYIATGDSGMGMTHGTIAGLLLSDLILGRPNPWAELFSPTRVPVVAAKTFVEENTNMAAQFADWVTGGDVADAADIAPGTGAVVRRGLSKVALYRDAGGAIHEMSAVCPHMGCVVRWNPGESTWDCPCHGSRFHADGRMLHGPAVDDLKPVEAPAGK